jgi:hypothetical protein
MNEDRTDIIFGLGADVPGGSLMFITTSGAQGSAPWSAVTNLPSNRSLLLLDDGVSEPTFTELSDGCSFALDLIAPGAGSTVFLVGSGECIPWLQTTPGDAQVVVIAFDTTTMRATSAHSIPGWLLAASALNEHEVRVLVRLTHQRESEESTTPRIGAVEPRVDSS